MQFCVMSTVGRKTIVAAATAEMVASQLTRRSVSVSRQQLLRCIEHNLIVTEKQAKLLPKF